MVALKKDGLYDQLRNAYKECLAKGWLEAAHFLKREVDRIQTDFLRREQEKMNLEKLRAEAQEETITILGEKMTIAELMLKFNDLTSAQISEIVSLRDMFEKYKTLIPKKEEEDVHFESEGC